MGAADKPHRAGGAVLLVVRVKNQEEIQDPRDDRVRLQNRCLPCRRCLPRSLRQTTPTRQTDLSSDRSYELRAHLSPPFPGADLYNSRPVLYNSLRGREAICTTHSERCVVFVAEELFCLNHRHFEADSFGYRRSHSTPLA